MNKTKNFFFNLLEKNLSFFTRLGINKKTPGASAIYGFLFRNSWPYGDVIEVQGSKMFVNPNEKTIGLRETFKGYAENRIHEKTTTDLFAKTIKEGDTVVDLGANIGYFTLLAARCAGKNGKVYSFEPEPKNFHYLSKNISINGYTQAAAFQKAASNKNGKTKLFICSYDTGHHTINQNKGIEAYSRGRKVGENSVEVETVAMDEFFKGREHEIDVIKMDVEGAEFLAFLGLDNILRQNKKVKMFVEFFPLLIRKMGNSPEELLRKIFNDYRFDVNVIPDDYNAGAHDGLIRVNSINEVMKYLKGEEDHINLFLTKRAIQ